MAVSELAAGCEYDFLIIDLEHGQSDEQAAFAQIAALSRYPVSPLVRIAAFRPEYVKRMLDFGAAGIIAPMIEDAEQAHEFARSMRYPPCGNRGMTGIFRASDYNNDFEEYYRQVDDNLLTVVQIESKKGVENIDTIAAVEGIDLLFIGHSDLSSDYGCYRQFSDPRIIEAEKRIIAAARANGKKTGMVLRPQMDLKDYIESGMTFIALGTDLGFIKETFRNQLNTINKLIK